MRRPPRFPDTLKFKMEHTEAPRCRARSCMTSRLERKAWVLAPQKLLDGDLIERAGIDCCTSNWASMLAKADSDGNVATTAQY